MDKNNQTDLSGSFYLKDFLRVSYLVNHPIGPMAHHLNQLNDSSRLLQTQKKDRGMSMISTMFQTKSIHPLFVHT